MWDYFHGYFTGDGGYFVLFCFFLEKLRHIYRNTPSNWTTEHNASNVSENKSKHLERRNSVDIQGRGIPSNDFVVGDVEMQVLSSSLLRCCLVGEGIAIALFVFRAKHQFLLIVICCPVVWWLPFSFTLLELIIMSGSINLSGR